MANLSIKVNIAGRLYPLTVSAREEKTVKTAAENLARKLKAFEQSYAVRDQQDLLAMCALQYATEAAQAAEEQMHINERIAAIGQEIEKALH